MSFRILVISLERRWLEPLHAIRALQALGAEVALLGHVDSLAARSARLKHFYALPFELGKPDDVLAILNAIDTWQPGLVLPGDDVTYAVLQAIVRAGDTPMPISVTARSTLQRSLGDPRHYATLLSKSAMLDLAESVQVTVPQRRIVARVEEAIEFSRAFKHGIVLKIDGESGGNGVMPCRNDVDIKSAFDALSRYLQTYRPGSGMPITAQRLIHGDPAATMFAAWEGRVLAAMHFRKLAIHPPGSGPATRVAPLEHAGLADAVRRFVAATGFSGLGSLDFVLDTDGAVPPMLECNPRMTALTHVAQHWGVDLYGALLAAAQGLPDVTMVPLESPRTLTLFPQEYTRARATGTPVDTSSEASDGPFDEALVMRASMPDWPAAETSGKRDVPVTASPRVLILCTENRWPAPIRVARQLRALGCEVLALAPVDSLIARSRQIDQFYVMPDCTGPFQDYPHVLAAIEAFVPDLMLPGDDRAFALLQWMATIAHPAAAIPQAVREQLIGSLGNPAGYPTLLSKRLTLRAAAQLGLTVPANIDVIQLADAQRFAQRQGGAVVLKIDGEASGLGVAICRREADIAAGFAQLQDLLRMRRAPPGVPINAQQFIEGFAAASVYAARAGQVLAQATTLTLQRFPEPGGPASVLRVLHNPAVSGATQRWCAALGISGMGSVDYVIERSSGTPYLIECNARMTSSCASVARFGVDLCAALIAGGPLQSTPAGAGDIVYFPEEWRRDPRSPFLQGHPLDSFFDEPAVMRAMGLNWPPPDPEAASGIT